MRGMESPLLSDKLLDELGRDLPVARWSALVQQGAAHACHTAAAGRPRVVAWRASKGRHGWQAQAAAALGVHRSTITRDVEAFLAPLNRDEPCPMCGHPSAAGRGA